MTDRFMATGHRVPAYDVTAGCVLWLQDTGISRFAYCEVRPGHIDCILEQGALDHPVIVLNVRDRDSRDPLIRFVIITSWDRTSLEAYFRNRSSRPPSTPLGHHHYDRQSIHYWLEDGRRLNHQCYIQTAHRYTLNLSMFYTFSRHPNARAFHYRLNYQSYTRLMRKLGIESEADDFTDPPSQTMASQTMASQTMASHTMASQTMASQTMASQTMDASVDSKLS
ncbi:hypothetical protein NHQ30_008435 [Ciborinia camelliae]|nr:hypothetical protein NHQ30_008435 [Ciborinia camelliae]